MRAADAAPEHPAARPGEVVERLIAALNAQDVASAHALIARDSFNHAAPAGADPGHAGWPQLWQQLFTAFDGFQITIEQIVEDGEMVATRYTHSGTQIAEFMGRQPSGSSFAALSLDMMRVVDGQIVEHWGLSQPWG